MKKENVVANKTIIWTVIFFVIAIGLSILNLIFSTCTGINIASLVAVSFLSFWYFLKGRDAHKLQNDKLNEIYDILTGSSVSDALGYKVNRKLSEVYVSIVLYSMHKSFCKGAFDYKVIDKKNPEVIRFVIQIMLSSFTSEVLNGYIGDDDYLVITTYNKDKLNNPITDGRNLIREYEHNTRAIPLVRGAVNRVNKACGINEKYSK